MNGFPKINLMNERAILIDFEAVIEKEKLEKVLFCKELLEEHYKERKIEVINTYSSLLLYFISGVDDLQHELLVIREKLEEAGTGKEVERELYQIPVCYDVEFGLDLKFLSKEKKLSIEEIIRLHSQPIYTVYFIGFLPGFPYLGGLDPKLFTSRKEEPRMQVPKGAIGIGEKQTGIYPKASPGGWQIIGSSPLSLFNKDQQPPCEITAGDRVQFRVVSKEEYLDISSEVAKGTYELEKQAFHG